MEKKPIQPIEPLDLKNSFVIALHPKELDLLLTFIDEQMEVLSNAGPQDDWEFPKDWTKEEIKEFVEKSFVAEKTRKSEQAGLMESAIESRFMFDSSALATLRYILKTQKVKHETI